VGFSLRSWWLQSAVARHKAPSDKTVTRHRNILCKS
jgi:hypothetical protein